MYFYNKDIIIKIIKQEFIYIGVFYLLLYVPQIASTT